MTSKTPDLHYYGPQKIRHPSREAWRNSSQTWEVPCGPDPFPNLRTDDGKKYPVTVRKINEDHARDQ